MLINQGTDSAGPSRGGDAAREFVAAIGSFASGAELCNAFSDTLRHFGLAHVIVGRLPGNGAIDGISILLNTFPKSWSTEYFTGHFMRHDALLAEMLRTCQPLAWSDLVEIRELTPLERRVLHLSVRHGLDCGLIVPVFEPGGRNGFVSMAGSGATLTASHRSALCLTATQFYGRITALGNDTRATAVALTDREVQVLRWIATGKSDWQIGQILEISAKTVNYHVENVKRKYDVATRIQAVVKAIRLGKLPE